MAGSTSRTLTLSECDVRHAPGRRHILNDATGSTHTLTGYVWAAVEMARIPRLIHLPGSLEALQVPDQSIPRRPQTIGQDHATS